jgi:hypothetical protein
MIYKIIKETVIWFTLLSLGFVAFFSYRSFFEEKERLAEAYGSFARSFLYVVMQDLDLKELESLYEQNRLHEIEPILNSLKNKIKAKYLFIYEVVGTNQAMYLADGSIGEDYSPPNTVEEWELSTAFEVLDGQIRYKPFFSETLWGELTGAYAKLFGNVCIGLEFDVRFLVSSIDASLKQRIQLIITHSLISFSLIYFFMMVFVRKLIEKKYENLLRRK